MTAGTIMHYSKLPLTLWFWAAYLMATHSNGISALQLQHQPGLGSYKSAWLLCAKLRRSRPCCTDQLDGRGEPILACVQAMRTDFRRPSSSMRFRTAMATVISVV